MTEAAYGFSPTLVASTVGDEYVIEIMREYLNTVNVILHFPELISCDRESDLMLCLHTIKSASLMVGAVKAGEWAASLEKTGERLQSPKRDEWIQDLNQFKIYLANNVEKINRFLQSRGDSSLKAN